MRISPIKYWPLSITMSVMEQTTKNNCERSEWHETYDVHGCRISMWHSDEHQRRPYYVNDTAPIPVMGNRDSGIWDLDKNLKIAWTHQQDLHMCFSKHWLIILDGCKMLYKNCQTWWMERPVPSNAYVTWPWTCQDDVRYWSQIALYSLIYYNILRLRGVFWDIPKGHIGVTISGWTWVKRLFHLMRDIEDKEGTSSTVSWL